MPKFKRAIPDVCGRERVLWTPAEETMCRRISFSYQTLTGGSGGRKNRVTSLASFLVSIARCAPIIKRTGKGPPPLRHRPANKSTSLGESGFGHCNLLHTCSLPPYLFSSSLPSASVHLCRLAVALNLSRAASSASRRFPPLFGVDSVFKRTMVAKINFSATPVTSDPADVPVVVMGQGWVVQ